MTSPDDDPDLGAALASVHDEPKRFAVALLMGGSFPSA